MVDKLISIIVPVYNVEDYLEDCVHSLELQTYKNIEIILVDDGSPDRSGKICDKLALKDARIKVIHKKNGGLSDARNEGLEHSNGEYIAFVDSDDIVEPNFIKVLYSLITQGNYQVAQVGTQFVNESGDPLNQKIVFDGDMGKKLNGNYVLNRDELIRGLLLRKVHCAAWCNLYKRDFFNEIRFTKGILNEDILMWVDGVEKVDSLIISNECLYDYRQRYGGITGGINLKLDSDAYNNSKIWLKRIEEKYPKSIEEANYNYFMCLWQIIKSRGDARQLPEEVSAVKNNIGSIVDNKYLSKGHKIFFRLISVSPHLGIHILHKIWLKKLKSMSSVMSR